MLSIKTDKPESQANQHIRGLFQQSGISVSGLVLIFWGLRIWSGGTLLPWIIPCAVTLILVGLLIQIAAWVPNVMRRISLEFIAMAGSTVGFSLWIYLLTFSSPSYGTDELAFDQYAARLFLRGLDPYTHNLAASFQKYLVPPVYYTYTLSGNPVTHLSYPALSFLLYVPALALGLHSQAAVYVDALFWVIAGWSLLFILPKNIKWLAPILLSLTRFDNYVLGGVTDSLFLPFLILALWRWDRFMDPDEPSIARWVGPIMLGCAMAIKQTPWFVAPFMVIGLSYESMRSGMPWWKKPLRYTLITAATFGVINLPFIIMAPSAWLRGIFLPLTAHTIPSGQGIIALLMFNHLGNGNINASLHAGLLLVFLALLITGLFYSSLKRVWMAFVPLLFFWPARSFASYLIDLTPAILVAAITVQSATPIPLIRKFRRIGYLGIGVLTTTSIALLLSTFVGQQPIKITITHVASTGQFSTIDAVTVRAKNRTHHAVRPHFTLMINAGVMTTFWITHGPKQLHPNQSATYILEAPNSESMPSILSGFYVDAFTLHPDTMSDTRLFAAPNYETSLLPYAINAPQPLGKSLTFSIQLRNHLGQPIHRAGIAISLGQVVYGQKAISAGETSINGHPEGQSPVTRVTNPQGVATFRIVGKQYQSNPVYFQAFISSSGYPYGYSNIVIIHFERAVVGS